MGILSGFREPIVDKAFDHAVWVGGGISAAPFAALASFAREMPPEMLAGVLALSLMLLRFICADEWRRIKRHRAAKQAAAIAAARPVSVSIHHKARGR